MRRLWRAEERERRNRKTSQNMKYTADLWQSRVMELLSQGTGVASTLQHLQILLQSFLKIPRLGLYQLNEVSSIQP